MNNSLALKNSARARDVFGMPGKSGEWLSVEDLDRIYKSGVYPQPEKYSYDPDAVRKRGRERAEAVLKLIPGNPRGLKSLEFGALDAMASYFLHKAGFDTYATDITDSHFTREIIESGVDCRIMDACDLGFDDNTFDLVFSFNALEHIYDPVKAINEAVRVLKPGGYLYLVFGPIWSSNFGAHGHESIPIPFIQYLWKKEILLEYCCRNNLGTIEFHTLNEWPASKYSDLWDRYGKNLRKVRDVKRLDSFGVDLIEKYPECFRGKVSQFDDLIVSVLEILFVKRD